MEPPPLGPGPAPGERELEARIQGLLEQLGALRAQRAAAAAVAAAPGSSEDGEPTVLGVRLPPRTRLVLASAALPVSWDADGRLVPVGAAAGAPAPLDHATTALATLHAAAGARSVWVGAVSLPQGFADLGALAAARDALAAQHRLVPVFVDAPRYALFTRGFARSTLAPLLHSVPPSADYAMETHEEPAPLARGGAGAGGGGGGAAAALAKAGAELLPHSEAAMWEAYVSVNQALADALRDELRRPSAGATAGAGGGGGGMPRTASGGALAPAAVAAATTQQPSTTALAVTAPAPPQSDDSDALVVVHDYELLLVPAQLRAAVPRAVTALFLHTPFPSSELYRILSQREALLRGLLGADVLGLQCLDYARHLLSSAVHLLGAEASPRGIAHGGRFTHVHVNPTGIDPGPLRAALGGPSALARVAAARAQFGGKTVLLAVDTPDATQGSRVKLNALEEVLRGQQAQAQAGSGGKQPLSLALVLVTLPPGPRPLVGDRTDALRADLQEAVGRINGLYATLAPQPSAPTAAATGAADGGGSSSETAAATLPAPPPPSLLSGGPVFFFESFAPSPTELATLYALADALLVTPTRDGYNLVAHEYVTARDAAGLPAAVVVSELAGAAQTLRGAHLVNPFSVQSVAEAVVRVAGAGDAERARRHALLTDAVRRHAVHDWGRDLLAELVRVRSLLADDAAHEPPRPVDAHALAAAYAGARHRVLFVDVEGVLLPLRTPPPPTAASTAPAPATVPPAVMDLLRRLAGDPRTTLVLQSSRGRDALERCLAASGSSQQLQPPLPAVLVAESGAFVRWAPECAWECQLPPSAEAAVPGWKAQLAPLFTYFADRTPGAVVDAGDTALSFYYGGVAGDYGDAQARDLASTLAEFAPRLPFVALVSPAAAVVQARPPAANKGLAAERVLRRLNSYRPLYQTPPEDEEESGEAAADGRDLSVATTPGTGRQSAASRVPALAFPVLPLSDALLAELAAGVEGGEAAPGPTSGAAPPPLTKKPTSDGAGVPPPPPAVSTAPSRLAVGDTAHKAGSPVSAAAGLLGEARLLPHSPATSRLVAQRLRRLSQQSLLAAGGGGGERQPHARSSSAGDTGGGGSTAAAAATATPPPALHARVSALYARLFKAAPIDFVAVLCAGADGTDEDLFAVPYEHRPSGVGSGSSGGAGAVAAVAATKAAVVARTPPPSRDALLPPPQQREEEEGPADAVSARAETASIGTPPGDEVDSVAPLMASRPALVGGGDSAFEGASALSALGDSDAVSATLSYPPLLDGATTASGVFGSRLPAPQPLSAYQAASTGGGGSAGGAGATAASSTSLLPRARSIGSYLPSSSARYEEQVAEAHLFGTNRYASLTSLPSVRSLYAADEDAAALASAVGGEAAVGFRALRAAAGGADGWYSSDVYPGGVGASAGSSSGSDEGGISGGWLAGRRSGAPRAHRLDPAAAAAGDGDDDDAGAGPLPEVHTPPESARVSAASSTAAAHGGRGPATRHAADLSSVDLDTYSFSHSLSVPLGGTGGGRGATGSRPGGGGGEDSLRRLLTADEDATSKGGKAAVDGGAADVLGRGGEPVVVTRADARVAPSAAAPPPRRAPSAPPPPALPPQRFVSVFDIVLGGGPDSHTKAHYFLPDAGAAHALLLALAPAQSAATSDGAGGGSGSSVPS